MPKTPSIPYDWVEEIDPEIVKLDEIPLFGFHPPFPWEEFSEIISKGFEGSPIHITSKGGKWLEGKGLTDDFGDDLAIQTVSLSGYSNPLTFIMSREDLKFLLLSLLNKEAPHELFIFEEELLEGFHRFFSLELIRAFSASNFEKTLSPHLHRENAIPESPAYGIDLQIQLEERTLPAKLLLSKDFQQEWKKKHSNPSLRARVSERLLNETTVTLSLEGGKSLLSKEELEKIKLGDILLLDQCYLDPDGEKGHLLLTLHGIPRLRGKYEGGKLKIEESGLFSEELTGMMKRRT